MATEILAIGTGALTSSDVVVAAGTPLTVCLKDAAGPVVGGFDYAAVQIQLKADNGEYFTVDTLTQGTPADVIPGAGTYRFSRPTGVSCGVFSG